MRHEQVNIGDIVRWRSNPSSDTKDGYYYAIVENTFYPPNSYKDEMIYEVRTFEGIKFRHFRRHFQKVNNV